MSQQKTSVETITNCLSKELGSRGIIRIDHKGQISGPPRIMARGWGLTRDNLITAYQQISAGTLSLEAVAQQLGVHLITLKRGFEQLNNSTLTGGKL